MSQKLDGISALDSVQYETLKAIADLCPETGGKVVLMARRRLQIEYDHLEWDDSECFEEEEEKPFISALGGEDHNKTVIAVFPNPTSSLLNVYIYNAQHDILHVNIVDIIGRNMASFSVAFGISTNQVSTEEWPSGMYFIKMGNLHSGNRISRRISIVR